MHLVFTKSQAQESFTNSSTSQFNDKNEHALFRELIQNALDAAQPNASAEVKISHHTVNTYEMPGLDDPRDFWTFNRVYAEFFTGPAPARSTVRSQLMVDAKIEIDVIAYKPV